MWAKYKKIIAACILQFRLCLQPGYYALTFFIIAQVSAFYFFGPFTAVGCHLIVHRSYSADRSFCITQNTTAITFKRSPALAKGLTAYQLNARFI
jgi:hypothetical protein